MRGKRSWLVLAIYLVFTLAPIYWMLHMSLRSNVAITSTFAWLPESLSFTNYALTLPGEDKITGTEDDWIILNGMVVKHSDIAKGGVGRSVSAGILQP